MKHSTRAPTKYEAKRIDVMMRLGCVACAVLSLPNINQLQCHHILSGGTRMGHWFTLPLCIQHHKGENWHELEAVEFKFRAAVHTGRKRFNAIYGTEQQLWERIQDRLKLPKVWPLSKQVPRRAHEMAQNPVELLASPVVVAVPEHGSPAQDAGAGDQP